LGRRNVDSKIKSEGKVDLKIKSAGLKVRKAWFGLKFQENKRDGLGLGPVLASIPALPYTLSFETEKRNSGERES